jgi:uncharacterized membrane protein YfcA
MSWIEITALIVSGVLVGFINTLAGGGSIVSLSILMFLGLPANIANGTNRIAILGQTLTGVASFKQQKVLDFRKGIILAIPAIIGSLVGAWIAVDINEKVFEIAVAVIMIFMLLFILYKPDKLLYGRKELIEKKTGFYQILIFFLIGVYGGFIHIGVGYFLLAGIVIGAGYDLVKATAIKVLIVLLYTPFTLIIFILDDQINWKYGLVLTIGTFIGAFVASRLAVSKGVNFVRWVIVIVILLTSAHLFGIFDIKNIFSSL